MASSPLSSLLPSLSPLRPHPHSPPLTPLRSVFIASPSRSSTLVVSAVPKKAYTSEEKQRILESYGLDPADFAPDPPSHKTERRRGRGSEGDKAGRGKRSETVPEETKKIPRTTHKLLQVLGGKSRRTKLLSPKGMDVRPMMEVVRGAAFDILQVAGGSPASLRPGRWLDLYSGTGSVGIEALSRGCSEVHFVEMDPWVVSEVLRPNLECTGFLDVSTIHTTRVESFLEKAEKSLGKGKSFDYVSITPPYTAVDYTILLEQIGNSALVGEDCFILVEYPLETSVMDSCGHLTKIADRRFGRTKLIIYGPEWAQKKRKSE